MIIETKTHRYNVISEILKTTVGGICFWAFISQNWTDSDKTLIYLKPIDITKMEIEWD